MHAANPAVTIGESLRSRPTSVITIPTAPSAAEIRITAERDNP